jgi:ribosome-associated protein
MTSPSASNDKLARDVVVRDVPIELCQLLKFGGLAASGGEAKQVVAEKRVLVNGRLETQKRKKLLEGDRVEFGGQTIIVRLATQRR